MAWTPYGYGPYGPGYYGVYPGAIPPELRTGAMTDEPQLPPSVGPGGGSASPSGDQSSVETQQPPYGESPYEGVAPPMQAYPGYGPWSGPPWGSPSFGGASFGPPSRFRISRATSDDAYTLTIGLDGMSPEEVQVRAQGQWITISRKHTEQREQNDSFDDGHGFMRSFSYSSGTASRRLSVPADGDLSAMSREDGGGSILIRIPRRAR